VDIKRLSSEVEQISQIYADKFNIERDAPWFVLKLQEEVGELIQCYLMLSGKARTKGKPFEEIRADFNKEVADVLCQTLLLARFYDIDLEREIEEKWLSWTGHEK
jgi:NTP pyrophosphatase (non-canonical NTP hydrolase)